METPRERLKRRLRKHKGDLLAEPKYRPNVGQTVENQVKGLIEKIPQTRRGRPFKHPKNPGDTFDMEAFDKRKKGTV